MSALLSDFQEQLLGWRRLAAAFGFGAVSILAMPPFGLWQILFLTMPGLVLLLDTAIDQAPAPTRRVRPAALVGWWFGFGYLLFGLYWIGGAFLVQAEKFALLMPFAITLLPAYLAAYYAMAAGAAALLWRPGAQRLLVLAITMTIGEWLRGHWFTGFPWNAIGYGLTMNEALAQSASLVGVTGLTFWAVLIFASPVLLLARASPPRAWIGTLCAGLLLMAAYGWGSWRLTAAREPPVAGVTLRLVQPNTPETDKFQPASQRRIFDRIKDLSLHNAAGEIDNLANTTVLIWPEEPLNFLMLQSPEALAEIGAMLGGHTTLISGAIRSEPDPASHETPPRQRFFNSLAVIDPNGQPIAVYDKIHLVPWGEYLPYENILGWFGLENLTRTAGGMASGTNPRRLTAPGIPSFSPLICYEAIFPGDTVEPGARPAWLLNVTNDAWFGEQTGPYQHMHQSVLRAIEEGLPLVRVAITGISAVVDAYGTVQQRLPLVTAGVIDSPLPIALPPTPYARYGDLLMLLQIVAGLVFVGLRWMQQAGIFCRDVKRDCR